GYDPLRASRTVWTDALGEEENGVERRRAKGVGSRAPEGQAVARHARKTPLATGALAFLCGRLLRAAATGPRAAAATGSHVAAAAANASAGRDHSYAAAPAPHRYRARRLESHQRLAARGHRSPRA